eukprot:FR736760.1.p3 GENE.FR736760.1~~FR736760.1.p3  ORF type:complete len:110 (+),score=52.03 FR736760.1:918-1247(+)
MEGINLLNKLRFGSLAPFFHSGKTGRGPLVFMDSAQRRGEGAGWAVLGASSRFSPLPGTSWALGGGCGGGGKGVNHSSFKGGGLQGVFSPPKNSRGGIKAPRKKKKKVG